MLRGDGETDILFEDREDVLFRYIQKEVEL